ncbi:microfibrillar-associated protein-related protein, partial [Prunus dulcis]
AVYEKLWCSDLNQCLEGVYKVQQCRDKLRGKIGQTKVKRYWPGKAPEWADDADEDGDIRMSAAASLEKAFPTQEYSDVVRKDDPRLRRLAESRIDNREDVRADHRRIRQAEIVSTIEEEAKRQEGLEAEEEDVDALEERRRRIKEKLLQREQEEAPLLLSEDEEEVKEEEEEESEYDTDSEEELTGMVMLKPVFVPKSERDTIAERERLEAEERALEESRKRNLEERKRETKQIVVEEIRKDEEIQKGLEQEGNIVDIDTDDEINEAEEYEAWKAREISRIKRDREDREAVIKEKEEIERVRNMTEEERRDWERKHPKAAPQPKQKWRFMQKYYHKGAFFQSEPDDYAATVGTDGIYTRDFSAPTGEDKMDKTILPKVMQVKHFGRSGRTKWTHLVNEDTLIGTIHGRTMILFVKNTSLWDNITFFSVFSQCRTAQGTAILRFLAPISVPVDFAIPDKQ